MAQRKNQADFVAAFRTEARTAAEAVAGTGWGEALVRLLLGSNALYYPAHGGGERSNRMVMEALARRGHFCFVVTRIDRFGWEGQQNLLARLQERGITAQTESGAVRFNLNGVEVLAATVASSFRAFFEEHKRWFRPDVIITSTDDPAQLLLEAALHDSHAPTVFLTRATVALPFGPDAAFPSREKTEALRQADGVVGVSNYVAQYIRQYSGIEAIHVPIAPAEPGPYPHVGRFENEFITLTNPCAVKGIGIFVECARALPHLRFAGVPTWGTTPEDKALMRAVPNISILEKVDKINDLLSRTRILMAPSVWAEARSRIVVEAMLAGVPVLASNIGGLPEAKMGVPYILPVAPIQGYGQRLNEQFVPIADVPPQDIRPWVDALERLTGNREHWDEIAAQSRQAALHYAETATVEQFETYISGLRRKERQFAVKSIEMPSEQLAKLSPERRKLLELRLQQSKTLARPVLPFGPGNTAGFRLFCFPHAGGSAGFFRYWREQFKPLFETAPVQYPGHENRKGESFAHSMQELVQSLLSDLKPLLTGDFAFFGHSMGAIVAFELSRALQREELPLPRLLIASAARAPQFRRDHKPLPDPAPEELMEQVRRLQGVPEEVLADSRMLDLIIPVLMADTGLYRRYVYHPEAPLPLNIVALGGVADPNVNEAHLAAWQEQGSGSFSFEQLPGGHFFLREHQEAFAEAVNRIFRSATAIRTSP
jgi:surfactin synthase thioesterase subunit/glycosyltransferase involved in cell wall biosynthesis